MSMWLTAIIPAPKRLKQDLGFKANLSYLENLRSVCTFLEKLKKKFMEGFLWATPEYCMLVNKTWLILQGIYDLTENQTRQLVVVVWCDLHCGAWDIMEVPKVGIYSRLGVGVKRFPVGSNLSAKAWSMVGISRTKHIQTEECVQRLEEKMEHGLW